MKIVINGVGIAGPTLAYWLCKAGHEVLLVEAAPRLRTGGYIIDFGLVGYNVAEKMGLVPRLRELGYQVKELRFVDQWGRTRGSMPLHALDRLLHGRLTSVRRSDLSATIFAALNEKVETIFDDSVAGIEELDDHVRVSFDRSPQRDFDLVIGADGVHSRVRQLVFGPDEQFEVFLGYHVAAFQLDGYRPRDELVYLGYGVPGRQVFRFSMRNDKTLFLFMFRDQYLTTGTPENDEQRKAALRQVFADIGWECPAILAAMDGVTDIYFDRVSQIRMKYWTSGRTALIGDAAACVSLLAGEGAGLAMAEAYILAGELHNCGSDHAAAFARYEKHLMAFLARKQAIAARSASSMVPKTSLGISFRNLVLRMSQIPFVMELFFGPQLRDEIALPDYEV